MLLGIYELLYILKKNSMTFILSYFCYLQNGNKSFVSVSDWQMRSLTGTFVFKP